MDDQTWLKDMKPFEWEELNGKTLRIVAGKQEGVTIVAGYDQDTKDIYVLHEEFSEPPIPLPTIKSGDKVKIPTKPQYGTGVVVEEGDELYKFTDRKWVLFEGDELPLHVRVSDLEVSHD